jgi:hypothetical protein
LKPLVRLNICFIAYHGNLKQECRQIAGTHFNKNVIGKLEIQNYEAAFNERSGGHLWEEPYRIMSIFL